VDEARIYEAARAGDRNTAVHFVPPVHESVARGRKLTGATPTF
jgi:hypothetical protein